MKKLKSLLIFAAPVLMFAFISGCSESTSYNTVPSFVIEKDLDTDRYLTARTEVTGESNEKAEVTIMDGSVEIVTIELSAGKPEKFDIFVADGFRKLNIYFISMVQPTHFVPGTVHIECDYTDRNGNGLYVFNGLIAAWALD